MALDGLPQASANSKLLQCKKGSSWKNLYIKKTEKNLDKLSQKLTHGELKPIRWKWSLSEQQVNKYDWPGRKYVGRLEEKSDENCRNLCTIQPTKSTSCIFDFCVDFVLHHMVLDTPKTTAGSWNCKPSSLEISDRQICFVRKIFELITKTITKRYSWQIKTIPMKAKAVETANK